jgi:hypothetical protein
VTLWIILGVLAYLATGYVITVLLVHFDNKPVKNDEQSFLIGLTLFWPMFLVPAILLGIPVGLAWLWEQVVKNGWIRKIYSFK